jgi:V/A-type H+-transporting ATPase subunit F
MYKIAVIGDRDSVLGFKALGLDVFFTETVEEARSVLRRLTQEAYAVIYLTEQLAQPLEAEIARSKDTALPAIILIPGKSGSLGVAEEALRKSVERAVGADIS